MPAPRSTTVLRFLDVVVVLVGAIPALALGAPALGYVMGAGGWIVARAIQLNERRLTAGIADPTRAVGVRLFAAFGRIWLLAAAIIIAGGSGLAQGRADRRAGDLRRVLGRVRDPAGERPAAADRQEPR